MPEPLKSSLDGQFPGNSNKERENKPTFVKPELSGKVTVKKESPFIMFYKAVFSGTMNDIKTNLWNRLVTVTKDAIYNTANSFLYDYIYDSSLPAPTQPNKLERSSLTNPDRYWNANQQRNGRAISSTYGLPDITFRTRQDAESVLKSLIAYRTDFPYVPISIYLQASDEPYEYTDEDWGWFSLDGVKAVPANGGGFKLTLPRPEPLPKNQIAQRS